jgi:hypothetical protein
LTIVGITKIWSLESFVIAVKKFSGEHTGIRIANALVEILNEWNIDFGKVNFFIRDGASNMKKVI